jgi:hypothetical protein
VVIPSVAQRGDAERVDDVLLGDLRRCAPPLDSEGHRHLQRCQHLPAVTGRPVDEGIERTLSRGGAFGLQSPLGQHPQGVAVERFEAEQRGATAQWGVHLEERVLGRGADERDEPVFDAGQQRVLLRLVEAVDLVEEQDRALVPLS